MAPKAGRSRRCRYLCLVAAVAVVCSRLAFIPSPQTPPRPGCHAPTALGWWSLAAAAAHAEEQPDGLPKSNKLYTFEDAKAVTEKLKAAGADANLLDEPVSLLPPDLPEGEKAADMVQDMTKEAVKSLLEGDLGNVANIAGNIVEEGLEAVQDEEFPWDKVGIVFFGFALLANSAQFVYPLLEEILEDEEDDYDRLPMPKGGAVRRPVGQIEEIDLKLPPKPMSETIAEKVEKSKKVEKKKEDFKEQEQRSMALFCGLLGSLVYVGYVVAQDLSAFRECPEVSSYYNVCCARLREEARQACMEYANWGFTQEDCLPWLEAIDTHCPLVCGDCWELGLRLRQECRFQLQVLNEPATAAIWCNETANDFMNNRCRPACEVNETMCASDEAHECMRTCGNYNTCTCRKFKGSQQPSFCDGFTFSDGVVNRRDDLFYDCALTPPSCKHTDGVTCNTYRYCTPDLCLIDDVDCSPRHQCEAPGRCDSEKGLCFYENQVDGYPCDDNIFYTLNDSCQNGFCEGTADFCLGYNVSCDPLSSCLSGGECHPSTGRCTYDKLPDETPCDDGRQFTVQDMCQNGLCVGRPQDLCEQRGVVCEAPNWCYDPGRCDPKTGLCSEPTLAPAYRPCNDQDPTTSNDSCIEGVCMGMLADGYEYQTIGAGECVDRENRRMARYAGDVKDQRECERICTGDPQCAGYAYNFPLCSIYGTVRTKIPMEMPTWSFQAGTDPLGVIIEASQVMTDVQRRSICRRKGVVPDLIVSPSDVEVSADEFFSPVRIGIFFLVLLGCFFALPLTDYISRLLKCRKDPLEEIASQVAQDPAQYDESPPHTEKGYGEDQLALEQEEYPGLEGLRDTANADDPVLPNEALPYDDRPEPPPDTPPNPPGTVA